MPPWIAGWAKSNREFLFHNKRKSAKNLHFQLKGQAEIRKEGVSFDVKVSGEISERYDF